MKAEWNGIKVEGTPEEIVKFKELTNKNAQPLMPSDYHYGAWWGIYPPNKIGTDFTSQSLKTQIISRNSQA